MAIDHPITRAALLGLALLSTACSQTSYIDKDVGRRDTGVLNPFDRLVEYHVDLGLLANRPNCVLVAPVAVADGVPRGDQLVPVVHAAVIARTQAALPNAVVEDLDGDLDAVALEARVRSCPYALVADLIAQDNAYFLVWSRKRIGIRVRLIRADDKEELWSAQHIASRSEGDLPLDPFGAIVTVFRTKDFADDKDVVPSMVDDALRRIFASFPAEIRVVARENDRRSASTNTASPSSPTSRPPCAAAFCT